MIDDNPDFGIEGRDIVLDTFVSKQFVVKMK